jgi:hypothetical protein
MILSFQPRIRGIEFVKYAFLMVVQRILPQAFEREKVKCISLNVGECGTDNCYERSVMKSRNRK